MTKAKTKAQEPVVEAQESKLPSQLSGLNSMMNLNKTLEALGNSRGIQFSSMDAGQRLKGVIPTGILSLDLVTNGGLGAGRMSYFYGDSGSGKSTLLFHAIKSAINRNTHVVVNDHESSFDARYLNNIGVDLEEVVNSARKQMHYALGTSAEATFRFMHEILKALPYKIELFDPKEDAHRYFLINPEHEFKHTWQSINDGLRKSSANKQLVVEVDDFAPQLFFVTDSLKAMLPGARDENPDANSMAILARTLGENFPLIKGLLAEKHCTWAVTNHLTINPMARFGNPETEPGGKAVQLWPDLKVKAHNPMVKSKIVEEPSLSGTGIDRYRPGNFSVTKNKGGGVFISAEYRIWMDSNGVAGMGIDPVFDTFHFLEKTAQVVKTGTQKAPTFKILIDGYNESELNWSQFKKLVIEDPKLHSTCAAQISSGKAQSLFAANGATAKSKAGKKSTVEAGESSVDEDGAFDNYDAYPESEVTV